MSYECKQAMLLPPNTATNKQQAAAASFRALFEEYNNMLVCVRGFASGLGVALVISSHTATNSSQAHYIERA